MVETRPQAYNVENESEVSDAFNDAMRTGAGAGAGLEPVPPVQYATAQTAAGPSVGQTEQARAVSAAYNNIASSFGGATTSYNAASQAETYGVAGSNFDQYV